MIAAARLTVLAVSALWLFKGSGTMGGLEGNGLVSLSLCSYSTSEIQQGFIFCGSDRDIYNIYCEWE